MFSFPAFSQHEADCYSQKGLEICAFGREELAISFSRKLTLLRRLIRNLRCRTRLFEWPRFGIEELNMGDMGSAVSIRECWGVSLC
jgi:hypothetical protein